MSEELRDAIERLSDIAADEFDLDEEERLDLQDVLTSAVLGGRG